MLKITGEALVEVDEARNVAYVTDEHGVTLIRLNLKPEQIVIMKRGDLLDIRTREAL